MNVVAPLIPYFPKIDIPLSFLKPVASALGFEDAQPAIHSFGALVAFGVYLGSVIAMRHARERKYDDKKMNDFIFWVVGLGFVGGHMLDAIFYHPDRLAKQPMYLFALWDGLSSYGGFIGAIIGAVSYKYLKKEKILGYCEVVNSAFPLAWVFGRMGCASVHDHPGKVSAAWFAVKNWQGYPPTPHDMGRFDLGLVECVLTIPLAVSFLVLWRRNPNRPLGFFTGLMCMSYAPVRFFLDFLRITSAEGGPEADPRYGGLTPAQWACFGLFALGVYFFRYSRQNHPDPTPRVSETAETEATIGEAAPAEEAPVEETAKAETKGKRKKARAKKADAVKETPVEKASDDEGATDADPKEEGAPG